MGDTAKDTARKKGGIFKNLKSEFKKIVWPDKEELAKQSAAVVVVSLFLGVVIAILDAVILYGIGFLVK